MSETERTKQNKSIKLWRIAVWIGVVVTCLVLGFISGYLTKPSINGLAIPREANTITLLTRIYANDSCVFGIVSNNTLTYPTSYNVTFTFTNKVKYVGACRS